MTYLRKIRNLLHILPLFLLLPVAAAFADGIPGRPSPPKLVNDLASLMSPDEQNELEKDLVAFNDTTSIQITIVTVNNLDGKEIASYAFDLGNSWGVGNKGKENGVVILVAKEERQAFIATGYGMEGVLPDALCATIVRRDMVPAFREEQYFRGFENAVNAIFLASKGEYKADDKKDNGGGGALPALIVLGIIIVIVLAVIGNRRGGGGGGGNYMSRGGSDFITGAILGSLLGGGRSSGSGFGGGFGGSSGGGGFGGFGGGSFGGGGAGGSW